MMKLWIMTHVSCATFLRAGCPVTGAQTHSRRDRSTVGEPRSTAAELEAEEQEHQMQLEIRRAKKAAADREFMENQRRKASREERKRKRVE